ncbi:MAG: hypothetical protein WAV20_07425 [Blastocatellia bacterium]
MRRKLFKRTLLSIGLVVLVLLALLVYTFTPRRLDPRSYQSEAITFQRPRILVDDLLAR